MEISSGPKNSVIKGLWCNMTIHMGWCISLVHLKQYHSLVLQYNKIVKKT